MRVGLTPVEAYLGADGMHATLHRAALDQTHRSRLIDLWVVHWRDPGENLYEAKEFFKEDDALAFYEGLISGDMMDQCLE